VETLEDGIFERFGDGGVRSNQSPVVRVCKLALVRTPEVDVVSKLNSCLVD
jgi:hypothetical protein